MVTSYSKEKLLKVNVTENKILSKYNLLKPLAVTDCNNWQYIYDKVQVKKYSGADLIQSRVQFLVALEDILYDTLVLV